MTQLPGTGLVNECLHLEVKMIEALDIVMRWHIDISVGQMLLVQYATVQVALYENERWIGIIKMT